MSIDVYYQPIPLDLVPRVFQYVRGEDSLEDATRVALLLAQTRARDEQWRLAIQRLYFDNPELFPPWFDDCLLILERPFFIVAEDSEEVVRTVDQYVDNGADAVDDIARTMIEKVDHRLGPLIKPERRTVLDNNQLRSKMCENVDVLRDCYKAWSNRASFRHPMLGPCDPQEIFETEFPSVALEFGRHCHPYWFNPGYGASFLLDQSRWAVSQFDQPAKLFEAVLAEMPEIGKYLGEIEECEVMGGVLTPDKTGVVHREAERIRSARPSRSTIGKHRLEGGFQALCEALAYAERHGLAYTEGIT
jgi:hypothetical protein